MGLHAADAETALEIQRLLLAKYVHGLMLKDLRLQEFICKTWNSQPRLFEANPLHQMPDSTIQAAQPGQAELEY